MFYNNIKAINQESWVNLENGFYTNPLETEIEWDKKRTFNKILKIDKNKNYLNLVSNHIKKTNRYELKLKQLEQNLNAIKTSINDNTLNELGIKDTKLAKTMIKKFFTDIETISIYN